MNYLPLAGAALALAFSSQISAQNYQFFAADKSPETQFCVNVGNNDVDTMRQKLRKIGTDEAMRRNVNIVTCNGMSPAQFAHKYKAGDTFKYLNIRSSPSKRVQQSVTISDIAKVDSNDEPILVYVSTR
jgi:hypothetical protein